MKPDSTPDSVITFTERKSELHKLTRRQLLKRSVAIGGSMVVGGGFVAASSATWALEVQSGEPSMMATLVQMARDIYPHDQFGDELYVAAIKGHDEKAAADAPFKQFLEEGVDTLNTLAQDQGYKHYLNVGWEAERTAILKSIEDSEFFQTIRGGLVVGLYNQEAVWDLLGYEGSSFEKGGYLERGFDDIQWV